MKSYICFENSVLLQDYYVVSCCHYVTYFDGFDGYELCFHHDVTRFDDDLLCSFKMC